MNIVNACCHWDGLRARQLDTKGRKALLEGGALKQLYFLASQKRSLAAVALIVGQLSRGLRAVHAGAT